MSKLAALGGALLMTLATVAPASANQKVHMPGFSGTWEYEVGLADELGFDCTGPVYYGIQGRADLWLWYPNSVDMTDPDEYMPEGIAWPWIAGQTIWQGFDYLSSEPGMGGTVISGSWKAIDHMTKHHPGTPGDPNDLESWQNLAAGKPWGIQAPGYGTVIQWSGSEKGTVSVVEQLPGPYDITEWVSDGRGWRGNVTFDAEGLCAFFGFEVAG